MSARHPRVPVTHADIEMVVGKFYARVRGHPLLGPIFFSTISHDPDLWREHEAKIARFWANAL
ncbi:globin family protein, partial [Rhodobacteraceae bacterium]|nr:globin family protein [Paracoccaceae bacterium]